MLATALLITLMITFFKRVQKGFFYLYFKFYFHSSPVSRSFYFLILIFFTDFTDTITAHKFFQIFFVFDKHNLFKFSGI